MIEWNDSLLIGVEVIDAQHRELFRRINTFDEAVRLGKGEDTIHDLLTFMRLYILTHFKDEEELMRQIDYPQYEKHRRTHEDFSYKHLDLMTGMLKNEPNVILSALQFLEQWFMEHVYLEDKNIGLYYKKRITAENQ